MPGAQTATGCRRNGTQDRAHPSPSSADITERLTEFLRPRAFGPVSLSVHDESIYPVCTSASLSVYRCSVDRTRLFSVGRLPLAGHAEAMCGAVCVPTEAAVACDAVVMFINKTMSVSTTTSMSFLAAVSYRAPCIVSLALTSAKLSCRGHNAHGILSAAAPLTMLCQQAATLLVT